MIQLCGLWIRTDRNGNQYFAGEINSKVRVTILKNDFKQQDNHPDYYLNIDSTTPSR